MKLRLEATPDELRLNGERLLGQLSKALSGHNPGLSEALAEPALYDALHKAEGLEVRERVGRELLQRVQALYADATKGMLDEIGAALDAAAG